MHFKLATSLSSNQLEVEYLSGLINDLFILGSERPETDDAKLAMRRNLSCHNQQ